MEQIEHRAAPAGKLRAGKEFDGKLHTSGLTSVVPEWAEQWKLQPDTEVPARSLCGILTKEEAKSARIIKIDVEGAEWQVIEGMDALLESSRPDLEIMVEVCPPLLEFQGKSLAALLALLKARGFNAYRIANEYAATAYIRPSNPEAPKRISGLSKEHPLADLIFSRIDAAHL